MKRLFKNSPRAKNTVFDIHPQKGPRWIGNRGTVSLRRHVYRRHPVLTSVGALALVLAVIFAADALLVGHANTVYWYPETCLGGWTNPQNAAGAPEVPPLAGEDEFTAENSAVLDNVISQLFCGSWDGDVPEGFVPTSVTLNISWIFKIPPAPEVLGQEDVTASSSEDISVDEAASTTIEVAPSEPEPEPEPEPESPQDPVEKPVLEIPPEPEPESAPEPEPAEETSPEESVPEEPASDTSLFRFIPLAFADETETPVLDPAPDDTATATPEEEILGVFNVTDDILEIRYSTDGETWEVLGTIGESNWQDTRFVIPLASWDDLRNLQVGLASLPVSDIASAVYLDGMALAVDYESIEPVAAPADQGLEAPDATEILDEVVPPPDTIEPVEPAKLKERIFEKAVHIDQDALHGCAAEPFRVEISGHTPASARILLERGGWQGTEELEIGSLPAGIDIVFSPNNDYVYQPQAGEDAVELQITGEPDSRQGDFSIVVIYTQKGAKESSTVCQMNIVNQ